MHKFAIAAALFLAALPLRADDCNPNWGYTGNKAPQFWGTLGYPVCASVTRQSPINFENFGSPDPNLPDVVLNDMTASRFKVERRAYDVEVKDTNPVWTLTWGSRHATLEQFHFHVKGEHSLEGNQQDAEIHFVFKENGVNARIVIAVWLKKGPNPNEALKKIIDLKPPACPTVRDSGAITIKMGDLLRNVNHYATYEGSLTTPACDENVTFIMALETLEATETQINALAVVAVPPGNVRPRRAPQHFRWREAKKAKAKAK